jgi:hypothetical protein
MPRKAYLFALTLLLLAPAALAQKTEPASTCMDGAQGKETCDPHVYYMAPPPNSGNSDAQKPVPALGVLAVFVAFSMAVIAVARLRHR